MLSGAWRSVQAAGALFKGIVRLPRDVVFRQQSSSLPAVLASRRSVRRGTHQYVRDNRPGLLRNPFGQTEFLPSCAWSFEDTF